MIDYLTQNWHLLLAAATGTATLGWYNRQALAGLFSGAIGDQAAFDAAFALRKYFSATANAAGMEAVKAALKALCEERLPAERPGGGA